MDTLLQQKETFLRVKEVLESQQLKNLRISNIYKAFQLQIINNKNVLITYSSDQQMNKSIWTSVVEYDDVTVTISDNKFIPIRAITRIKLK